MPPKQMNAKEKLSFVKLCAYIIKALLRGKIEGGKRRGCQRIRWGWMASPAQWAQV